ncbi:MAG: type II toxin-antitoxin system HicA family toxin [Bacteroidetes bacterium]|nr:type II toxin-antitoxin system HicA family toxin [Bacteroidota bacterium]
MGTFEKLLERFLARPKDFTYDELRKLLTKLGYKETTKGKTSGSRVAFIDEKEKHIIRVHKPHPGNILKEYIIKQVIKSLHDQGKL